MQRAVFGVLLAVLIFNHARASEAAAITLEPATQPVTLGDQVTLSLWIRGVGDLVGPSVGAFDVDITFDAALFSVGSFLFGSPIDGDKLDLFGLGSVTSSV